ncbi:MAG TPA: hypothetical protein VKU35_04050 [Candidatus Limnocylindria bacterium]|nr:hypothetical protein [Candidatus Limnocylindria bacterium]
MASRPFDGGVPTGLAASPAPIRRPGFVRTGLLAAAVAAERVALWVPGALAAISFLGWVPFVLAIVTLPSVGDLGFFGSSLGISPNYPWNVALLALAVGMAIVAASIVIAGAEASLQREIESVAAVDGSQRSLDDEIARLWAVQVVAAVPALVVTAVTLLVVASVAQGEYQSPDIGGPFAVRVARDVWPLLVALLACVLAGQAFGASAQRAVRGRAARTLPGALAFGLHELLRRPLRIAGLTLLTDVALLAWLGISWALLHVLWAPIGRAVGRGALLESGTALLLVGFVAIWLCLVAAGGALHAWSSLWWSLEIGRDAVGEGGGWRPRMDLPFDPTLTASAQIERDPARDRASEEHP